MARPTLENRLTDLALRRVKPGPAATYLSDGGGLYARVLPANGIGRPTIRFEFQFKIGGKTSAISCGNYPETSLAAARDRRNAARKRVAQGIDPREHARQVKAATLAAERDRAAASQAASLERTVETLFTDWRRRYLATARKDGGAEIERAFRLDVFPAIGPVKAREVTRRQVAELLDAVVDRGARRTANMTLTSLRQMFRWALARDIVPADPTVGLTKRLVGGEEKPCERALSFDEVALLLEKLPRAGLAAEIQAAVKFILATGCRAGELTNATWAEIEPGGWRIPAANSKNGEEHFIHLSDFALAQLAVLRERRRGAWLLAGRREDAPYDPRSLSKMLRDRLRATPLKNRTAKHAGTLALPGGEWSPHDLRRTMASRMGDLGILPHVIERCLGHRPPNKIVATYQRQEYLAERTEAFCLWGARLALLADPQGNVVILPARA
jgi:integrase